MSGLALVASFAMSAVLSTPALAVEHFFNATQATKLTDKNPAGNEHVFTTKPGGTQVKCKEETSKGEAVAGKQKTNVEEVTYKSCTALGFPATVKPENIKYEFSAEGWVSLQTTVTIEVPLAGCHVTVKAPQNELKEVSYTNLAGGKLEVTANVKNISSEGSGGSCGGASTEGTYTGKSVVTPEVGELKWE
jgi:hypothetical protein